MLSTTSSMASKDADSSFEEDSFIQSFEETQDENDHLNNSSILEVLAAFRQQLDETSRKVAAQTSSPSSKTSGASASRASASSVNDKQIDGLEIVDGPLDTKGKASYMDNPTVINSGNEPFHPYPFGIGGYSYKDAVKEILKESNQFILVGARKSGKQFGRPNNYGKPRDFLFVSYNQCSFGQYLWISTHVFHEHARDVHKEIIGVKNHIVRDWIMLRDRPMFIENKDPVWDVKELDCLNPEEVNALDDEEIRQARETYLEEREKPFTVPGATSLNDDAIVKQLDGWIQNFDTNGADYSYLMPRRPRMFKCTVECWRRSQSKLRTQL